MADITLTITLPDIEAHALAIIVAILGEEQLEPGDALTLFSECAEPGDKHAMSCRHRDVRVGYVPRRHRWIVDAIDDGLRLLAIVELSRRAGVFRRRATFVRTRIVVLHDGC